MEKWRKESRIDLVAVGENESPVIGCEVKLNFDDFTKGEVWERLQAYVSSNYFDEVYIAIPHNIVDHVLGSYGHVFYPTTYYLYYLW